MSDDNSLQEGQEIDIAANKKKSGDDSRSKMDNNSSQSSEAKSDQPKEKVIQEIKFEDTRSIQQEYNQADLTVKTNPSQSNPNQANQQDFDDTEPLMEDNRLSNITNRILPLSSIASGLIVVLFGYLFFSGQMYRFYASALFGFYALTNRMWVSVMLLGVFQTLILVPLRIIRVARQTNIKTFVKKVESEHSGSEQIHVVQQQFKAGNRTFLFYLIDFIVQLTTFLTIGRLFLTDFYNNYLDPARLYDWIPYPDYPIMDRVFHLPYPVVTKTISLGWWVVIFVWLAILVFQLILTFVRTFLRKSKRSQKNTSNSQVSRTIHSISKYSLGYLIIAFVLSWFVLTHIPVGLGMRVFKGDVGVPNRTLNTVTAVATFLTLLWFSTNEIIRKGKKAVEAGMEQKVVDKSQQEAFSRGIFNAFVVGLGAFFITNQIPSAFELSIFVLEIISLLSPFTLDRLIVAAVSRVKKPHEKEA